MHPVLFELPLPRLSLPLGVTLAVLAGVAAVLAGVGFRRRLNDLAGAGALSACAALAGAVWLRGAHLALAPVSVPAFGALLAVSLALGGFATLRLAERSGLARERAVAACVAAGVAGVLGARAGYALLHPREIGSLVRVFAFYDGGLAGTFGVAAALVAVWLALEKNAAQFRTFLDAAAPGFALGVCFTRVGCWLEGCDYGRRLAQGSSRWLETLGTFPAGSRAWVEQAVAQELSPSTARALPVHPAQLYEALGALLLAGIVLRLQQRQRARGQAGLFCLAGFALVRVVADTFRDASADVWAARVFALVTAALAVLAWSRLTPVSRPA